MKSDSYRGWKIRLGIKKIVYVIMGYDEANGTPFLPDPAVFTDKDRAKKFCKEQSTHGLHYSMHPRSFNTEKAGR